MRQVEAELDRNLTLLRNKIRDRGFTQLEVQEVLGWGRSYISQLLTKQKSLRVEQVLLILKVIGVDSEEYFAELYAMPGAPRASPRRAQQPADPGATWELGGEFEELGGMLRGLVQLLLEKQLISGEELRGAAEAAAQEP